MLRKLLIKYEGWALTQETIRKILNEYGELMRRHDDEDRTTRRCNYCKSDFETRRGIVITSCNCENYEPGDTYY